MAKALCVLYDDPVTGYPNSYARDDVPKLDRYPNGQALPTPQRIDFLRNPGNFRGASSASSGCASFSKAWATP